MTQKLQGNLSNKAFEELYDRIIKQCIIENMDQLFNDDSWINIIRNSKYKMTLNFKALFGDF